MAVRSDTGEVLHIRNRKGKANTQRGIARFIDELLARVRRAGHTGQVIIRADTGLENQKLFAELAKRGIAFSIGVKLSKTIRALIEQIPETAWVTVADYPEGGETQVAEIELKGFRLIVRRTRLTGKQADLFPNWRHHPFATNRTIPLLVADTDHRDHATVEFALRDLIDQALARFPSGQMHVNSAWTVIAALAHKLGRWTSQIGLPNRPVQTARSRRRQLLQIPARLTRTSRQWTPDACPLAVADRLHHRARRDPRAHLTRPPADPQFQPTPAAATAATARPDTGCQSRFWALTFPRERTRHGQRRPTRPSPAESANST